MEDSNVKREFFQKMGFCECTYCMELFYDYDEYIAHECDLQGLYPDGYNFKWSVS